MMNIDMKKGNTNRSQTSLSIGLIVILVVLAAIAVTNSQYSIYYAARNAVAKTMCEMKPNYKYGTPRYQAALSRQAHCYNQKTDVQPHGVCSPGRACIN